jgi:hypothetical protein
MFSLVAPSVPSRDRARSGMAILAVMVVLALFALTVYLVIVANRLAWVTLALLAVLSLVSKAYFSLWRNPAAHESPDPPSSPGSEIDS